MILCSLVTFFYIGFVIGAGCIDSDGGVEIYIKGVLTSASGSSHTDYCYNDDYPSDYDIENNSGHSVIEMFCTDEGIIGAETFGCPNGCENGACVVAYCEQSGYFCVPDRDCSSSGSMGEGFFCESVGDTCCETKKETPLSIKLVGPMGRFSYSNITDGIPENIGVYAETSKPSVCLYSLSGVENMSVFSHTGNLSHYNDIPMLEPGEYKLDVLCRDDDDNEVDSHVGFEIEIIDFEIVGYCIADVSNCPSPIKNRDTLLYGLIWEMDAFVKEGGETVLGTSKTCVVDVNENRFWDFEAEGAGACAVVTEVEDWGYFDNTKKEEEILKAFKESGGSTEVLDAADATEAFAEIESEEVIHSVCAGCLGEDKCYPYNFRVSGNYCNIEGELVSQLEDEAFCDNDFECRSNLCVGGKCLGSGLWQKILDFFGGLFG